LFVPACILIVLAGVSAGGGARRSRARVMFAVFVSVFLLLQVGIRSGVYERLNDEAGAVHARNVNARALMNAPGVKAALHECRAVAIPSGRMIHLFAYYSGRSPDRFSSDERGRTRPDIYVAPANDQVAEDALTRPRFDDDPTFTVPASLEPGPRNRDWVLHVSPASGCVRGLR
jgi:hypothetical protein